MRHVTRLVVVLFLTLAATGCDGGGDPYVGAAEKTVANAKELSSIVGGVKTEADADAAVPKLEALAKDFERISADLKKQPKMTEAQKKKVQKIFNDAKGDMEKMNEAEGLSADPEVAMKVAPAVMKAAMAMTNVAEQLELQATSGQQAQ